MKILNRTRIQLITALCIFIIAILACMSKDISWLCAALALWSLMNIYAFIVTSVFLYQDKKESSDTDYIDKADVCFFVCVQLVPFVNLVYASSLMFIITDEKTIKK